MTAGFLKNSFGLAALIAAVLTIVVATAPERAVAQGAKTYQEIPIDPAWTDQSPAARNALKERERLIGFIFLGTKPFEENRRQFQEFYTNYYFRLMTHEDHLTELPADREKFLRYLRSPQMQSPQMRPLHDFFVSLLMNSMKIIAQGNFHPVARYNAMLMIGELNSEEAVMIGDSKRQAVPLIEALPLMLAEFDNPQQIDAVKVAALVGILRHVKIDREMPSGRRRLVGNNAETRIVDVMASVINQKEASDDRDQSGHDWMRRRAMELLGELGVPGQGGKVVRAIESVLADPSESIQVRCTAAEALGRLNLGENYNADQAAKKLGEVAAAACYVEIARVETLQAREKAARESSGQVQPGGASYSTPTRGAFGSPSLGAAAPPDPLSYRVNVSRRRIKHQMLCVRNGLAGRDGQSGLLAAAGANKQYVEKVIAGVDQIAAITDADTYNVVDNLLSDVRSQVKRFENACQIVVQLPAGADPSDLLIRPLGVDSEEDDLDGGPPAAAEPGPGPAAPVTPPAEPPAKKFPDDAFDLGN